MQSKNIKIVADMETCANTNATITDIKLADPLEKLFGLLPSLDNMPHVPNVETARRELLQDIKFEIRKLPDGDRHSLERLPALAQPTVMRLSTVRPQMSSQIAEYTDWKRYLFFIFNALAVHILLHLLGKVYNHYIKRSKRMSHWLHRRPPFRTEHNGRKIKGKPVSVVSTRRLRLSLRKSRESNHTLHSCYSGHTFFSNDGRAQAFSRGFRSFGKPHLCHNPYET